MATAPLNIYETTPAQELYETSPEQEIVVRASGLHFLQAKEAARAGFVAQWENLVTRVAEPNPFFEPWYLLPSMEEFDRHGETSIATYYAQGRLVGLIPLALKGQYYGYPMPHISSWLHANSFCGAPLITKGYEREFWAALLAALDRNPSGALFLHLPLLPADEPIAVSLSSLMSDTSRAGGIVREQNRAMLHSEMTSEQYYAASMTRKRRKELRRLRTRLGEEGCLEFVRQSNAEGLDNWINEFLALEQSGWKGEEGSSLANEETTAALFRNALVGAASSGKLERIALRLDGKPIAMLANFITAPGAFSFKTAFDESYARYSPGVLLQLENLALLDRNDIDWCDSCAVEGHQMIERIWREKRRMVSLNIAIGGNLRRSVFSQLLRFETREKAGR